MVINIDIKIADDEGNLLQRFEKKFDECITDSDRIYINMKLGKSFEEFLSEYTSFSGRTLREKLSTLNKSEPSCSGLDKTKNIMITPLIENNPVKEFVYPDTAKKNIAAYSDNEQAAIVTMVNYAMKNAIDKYEANLYPISIEQEYTRLESELAETIASKID